MLFRSKVRRRIDVRVPLADVRELLHQETVFLDGVKLDHLLLAKPLPVRGRGTKGVREVDEFLVRQSGI